MERPFEFGFDQVVGFGGTETAIAAEVDQVQAQVIGVLDITFDALQGRRVVFAEHGGVEADFHVSSLVGLLAFGIVGSVLNRV